MSLCELQSLFHFFSTVEKQSGIVEAANFPLFHTPYKGVEKWKKPHGEKRKGLLS
jgi:hypothetical protein